MGKIWIEVCLISARGLKRTSSLWKLQWYAVGWIDPNNKYCSKIDSSGNENPVWKTKFSILVDISELNLQDLALHVEVYSREPIFLREKLLGTATVILKEFLDKYNKKNSEVSKPIEEVGSFQLRKKNSNKPQGFVDISIRISEEREEPSSQPGDNEGFKLVENSSGFNLANGYKPASPYPQGPQPQSLASSQLQQNQQQPNHQYAHPMPFPTNYSHPSMGGMSYTPAAGPSYQPPCTPPPPPPPPSNFGYIPTFLPSTGNMPPSNLSMPQTGAAATRNARPGFGVGVGAGALAAGAVIFGDDFMSGFDLPRGLQDPSLTISLDPPF